MNSNTELSLINTSANSGTITLPLASSIPGRVVEFKDIIGKFGTNTLTLNTSGSDTFEDGGTSKILKESYGSIQLVASGTKWYLLNGTQVNTLQVSTLNANLISSINISTSAITASSITFIDNRNSTNFMNISTNMVSTSFLYYNNYIIAGTRVGYSNLLNTYFFSLFSIRGLSLWLDAADPTTVVLSGANVTQWNDKSGYGNNATTPTAKYPTYSSNYVSFSRTAGSIMTLNGITTAPTSESIFIVFSYNNPGNNLEDFLGATYGGRQLSIYNQILTTFYSQIGIVVQSGNLTQNVTTLIDTIYDGNTLTHYVNASTFESKSSVLFSGSGVTNLCGNTDCSINEIIVYNTSLTTLQRQQMEGYLAWKWGLQANLPASHPYYNGPP